MNPQIDELLQSFETKTKTPGFRYNEKFISVPK